MRYAHPADTTVIQKPVSYPLSAHPAKHIIPHPEYFHNIVHQYFARKVAFPVLYRPAPGDSEVSQCIHMISGLIHHRNHFFIIFVSQNPHNIYDSSVQKNFRPVFFSTYALRLHYAPHPDRNPVPFRFVPYDRAKWYVKVLVESQFL